MKNLFTSESVTIGHPDKVCDQISDAVLDAYFSQDKDSKVACECLIGKGLIVISGEITSKANIHIKNTVRDTLNKIGYNPENFKVLENLSQQSPDIAMGVNPGGAGDQGMMFGYACNETPTLMPLPIYLAHKLTKALADERNDPESILEKGYLLPDGKAQVTINYNEEKLPSINTIVVSSHHKKDLDIKELRQAIFTNIIHPVIDGEDRNKYYKYDFKKMKIFINPTGRFEIGGPEADTGLTGRKIIVDTYGGIGRHGGGAFSGKDPSKVDRSAAYMARYLAKYVVANKLAEKCEIQLAYAIGIAKPVSVNVNTFGELIQEEEKKLASKLSKKFDLTPQGIISFLDLKRSIYQKTAENGHFGNPEFPWENIK